MFARCFVSHTVLVGGNTGKMRGHKPPFFRFSTSWKRPSTWSLPTGAADFWGTMLAACLLPKQFNLALQKWQGEGLYQNLTQLSRPIEWKKTFGEISDWVEKSSLLSLKLTASLHLKTGWLEDDPFLLGWPIFRGELLVSWRVKLLLHGPKWLSHK